MTSNNSEPENSDRKLTRRQYIKYAAGGMAAVAATVAGLGYYASRPLRKYTTTTETLAAEATTTESSFTTATTCMGIAVPTSGCYLGAYIGDFPTIQEIDRFADIIGKRLAILNLFYSWGEGCEFPTEELVSYVENGHIPMISWKPVLWDPINEREVPAITLQDIIESRWDDYLQRWADDARAFGHPLFLRFGSEMNGDWDPHCGANNFGTNGDKKWDEVDDLCKYYGDPKRPDGPERYVDAWRHIHGIFRRRGAKNVILVWAPNFENWPNETWNSSASYYPGDEYVDWVGVDLYNFGYIDSMASWRSFDDLFSKSEAMRIYGSYTSKPFMLGEYGCSQAASPKSSGDKGGWITEAFHNMKNRYTAVRAAVWFSEDNRDQGGMERDWRIDSSSESLAAYRDAISDSYFLDHTICQE